MKRIITYGVLSVLVIAILIQLIPYGHDHTNPSINVEPRWDSPETRALAQRACFDCHSNQTVWPWYSSIAPVSWLIYQDVTEGREHINFSDWNRLAHQHLDELQEVFEENSMPPASYLLLHPTARLSPAERQKLFAGLMMLTEGHE